MPISELTMKETNKTIQVCISLPRRMISKHKTAEVSTKGSPLGIPHSLLALNAFQDQSTANVAWATAERRACMNIKVHTRRKAEQDWNEVVYVENIP